MNELMLYDFLKTCFEYYKSKDRSLFNNIYELWYRYPDIKSFVKNSLSYKRIKLHLARIDTICDEDITSLKKGSTLKLSNAILRPWCKNAEKLETYVKRQLHVNKKGDYAVILEELIDAKNIIIDFEAINQMIQSDTLKKHFKSSYSDMSIFKELSIDNTVMEVLIDGDVNQAEVSQHLSASSLDAENSVIEITDKIKNTLFKQ